MSLNPRVRKIVDWTVGLTLIGIGIVLSLPLVPGPGILSIIAGLAVLSSHNRWAHALYTRIKHLGQAVRDRVTHAHRRETRD